MVYVLNCFNWKGPQAGRVQVSRVEGEGGEGHAGESSAATSLRKHVADRFDWDFQNWKLLG